MFTTKNLTHILILFIIFLFSIYIRLPNLQRPLAGHHEGITAHALTTLQNWQNKGLIAHHFSPILSYPVPGQNHTACINGSICDQQGNVYYVSYPPFAFYAPYIVFKLLFIYPDVIPIRIFNLFVGFGCALGIFYTVKLLLKKEYPNAFIPPLLGFFAYIFNTESLWFHGNVYFSEIFAQLFFVLAIYLALKIIIDKSFHSWSSAGLLGMVVFLGAFTEWLGVLVGVILLVYFLFHFRDAKRICIVLILALVGSVALTFIAYSQVNGFSTIYMLLKNKFISRSGLIDQTRSDGGLMLSWDSSKIVVDYYRKGFGTLLYSVGLFAVVSLYVKRSVRHWLTKEELAALIFAFVPALLHHVLFFNFTAIHDFSVLKGTVFLSLFLALFFAKSYYHVRHSRFMAFVPVLILMIVLYTSAWDGYIKENAFNDTSSFRQYTEGKYIANTSTENDVVFMKDGGLDLNVFFYSKRWILSVGSKSDAINILERRGYNNGVIYYKDPDTAEMSYERISVSNNQFEQINIMPDQN
jgi:hypothetical protein